MISVTKIIIPCTVNSIDPIFTLLRIAMSISKALARLQSLVRQRAKMNHIADNCEKGRRPFGPPKSSRMAPLSMQLSVMEVKEQNRRKS